MHEHIWSVSQGSFYDGKPDILFVRCSRCGASLTLELPPDTAQCRGYFSEPVSSTAFREGEGAL